MSLMLICNLRERWSIMAATQVQTFRRTVESFKTKLASGSMYTAESMFEDLSVLSECLDSVELWETDGEILFQAIVSCSDLVKTAIERIDILEKENSHFKEQLKQLNEKCRLLENSGLKLMAGQLAFEIEQGVVSKILPGISPNKHVNTIYEMEKAIKGKPNFADIFDTEDARKKAEISWNTLKHRLGWTGRHYRFIQELKQLRLPIAHPNFDPKTIRESLESGALQISDRQLFAEFLKIYDQLSSVVGKL